MRRTLALLATLAVAAGVAIVPSLGAGAAIAYDLRVELVSPVEPLTFSVTVYDDSGGTAVQAPLCDTVTIVSVEANGNPVTPLATTPDGVDTVLLTLPSDTAPGELFVEAECGDGEFPAAVDGGTEWAALAVTKVVQGTAPADAQFVVEVACLGARSGSSEFTGAAGGGLATVDAELTYGAGGGVHYVYFNDESECTITETENAGATTTTITPDEVVAGKPIAYTSTVTNVFPAEIQPTFTG